jgi:hypothetical protein
MFQVIYEYKGEWPEEGPMQLNAQWHGEIRITPEVARRKVGGYLAGHVSMMVLPGEPVLVVGKRPIWRVPAQLHLPGIGEVATLGDIDVDATTGSVLEPGKSTILKMQQRAHEFAAHLTPATTTPV